jgi:IclR family mhp operon transcriptional activator
MISNSEIKAETVLLRQALQPRLRNATAHWLEKRPNGAARKGRIAMTMPVDAAYAPSGLRVPPGGALLRADAPDLQQRPLNKTKARCRTNSRRGSTDPAQRSYPPVQAVCRAFDVLRAVNRLRIASIQQIHEATGFPKPTIVRMLETLLGEGYVARDNMCGGYCVTSRVHELTAGHHGITQIIEIARPFAIELTREVKWPIGIGVLDDDAIAIKFWTGSISPLVHTNTVLGLRPDFVTTAMGRALLAYCPDNEREQHIRRMRADPARAFGEAEETRLRSILRQVRIDGFATRDPKTQPHRISTFAMPIREGETVQALINISFFTTAVAKAEIAEKILAPLRATTAKIESAILVAKAGPASGDSPMTIEPAF